jgi:hypothetical protein
MSVITKGFLGLLAWLIVGFGVTEVTVLVLNAWIFHEKHSQSIDSVASITLPT